MPLVELHEKRVLLTGGSQGIGAAAVRALHSAGARVMFTYRSRADLADAQCAELGDRVCAEFLDLADAASLPGIVDRCVDRLGGIDVLVNNAAIYAENRFDGTDLHAWRRGWERTFAVNVFAAADLAWLAIRAMRRAGTPGTIVNVASRAAHRGELTFADYGASKAALVNLTKSIARACAPDGITAFAVAPGFITTEMAAEALAVAGDAIAAEIPSGASRFGRRRRRDHRVSRLTARGVCDRFDDRCQRRVVRSLASPVDGPTTHVRVNFNLPPTGFRARQAKRRR